VAQGVVDLLEAVEVEEDERKAVAVASRALELQLQLPDEGLVVEEPGQLVVPRLVGELGGGPVEVGDDALGDELVDRVVESPLAGEHVLGAQLGCALRDEPPQHTTEDEELGHDLAGSEAVGLALPRVLPRLRGKRASAAQPLRLRVDELVRQFDDERRHVPELPEASVALE